jgi:hypothetical protein
MSDDGKKWLAADIKAPNNMADAAMSYFGTRDLGAKKILQYLMDLVPLTSAVDFGTGNGRWLATALELGATEVRGYDVPAMPTDRLMIPQESYTPADLSAPMEFGRKYDIAISTEVAEHIEPECAAQFVANICASSDLVLFSAALPYQGGVGHLNETWVEYWAKRFREHRFACYDIIRTQFWHDGSVRSFYRQNLLVFARFNSAKELQARGFAPTDRPLTLIHPEQYLKVIGNGLPPELRQVGPDVTQYYHCVTKTPDEVDADEDRIVYGPAKIGWDAILKHFGT